MVDDDTTAPGQDATPPVAAELAEHLGVEITSLQVAMGGTLINLNCLTADRLSMAVLVWVMLSAASAVAVAMVLARYPTRAEANHHSGRA